MKNSCRWGKRFSQSPFSKTARRDFGDINREYRPDRTADDWPRRTSRRVNHEVRTMAARGGDGGSDDRQECRYEQTRPGRLLLVHGLGPVPVNCDRAFNLFCLYGNVTTVKVIRDDKVLVEMEDVESAKRCVLNLHHLPLTDGRSMKVKYSKHAFIHDHMVFNQLPDGTPAQKDYTASKLNRFIDNEMCHDIRRVASPSKILHFFNAPTDLCGMIVHKAVLDTIGHADAISSITILPMKPGAKCSTGLIEFKSIALAARAVLMSNHMTMKSTKSKFPFVTKLCFSKWSNIQQTPVVDSAATLRFSSSSHTPWMLHKSEHAIPATELPISKRTVVTGDSGGNRGRGAAGDSPWTLWSVKSEESAGSPWPRLAARVAPAVSPGSEGVGHDAEHQQRQRQLRQCRFSEDKYRHNYLLDMLRNHLCRDETAEGKGSDDQGDAVQTGAIQEAAAAAAAGAVEIEPSSSYDGAAQDATSSSYDGAVENATSSSYDGATQDATSSSYDGAVENATSSSYDGATQDATSSSYDGAVENATSSSYDGAAAATAGRLVP